MIYILMLGVGCILIFRGIQGFDKSSKDFQNKISNTNEPKNEE